MTLIVRALFCLFFALTVVGPLGALMRTAVSPDFTAHFFDPTLIAIAWASVTQASASVFFSLMFGMPMGVAIGTWASSGRFLRASRLFLGMPYGIPTIVVANTLLIWLGRTGILARWGLDLDLAYSLGAVILAHTLLNAPWIALVVANARADVPRLQLESARTLGASYFYRFRRLIWPYLSLPLFSACTHVFALCLMSFALVLILGGGPPVQTLETAIYSRIRFGVLDLEGAVICALWQLGLCSLPWLIVLSASKRRQILPVERELDSGGIDRWRSWVALGACFLFLLPYVALFKPAVITQLVSPDFLIRVAPSFRVSLMLASMASLISMTGALMATLSGTRWVSALAAAPSGLSTLVLGLGVWLAYGRWVDPFEGSLLAMAVVQGTLFMPIAFRMLWPLMLSRQQAPMEAARTLGASRWMAFRTVEWPRWHPPLLSAAILVMAASVGEIAAVSLFYSEVRVPLPLLLSRWLGQYRFEDAAALSTLLFLISMGMMMIVWSVRWPLRRQYEK